MHLCWAIAYIIGPITVFLVFDTFAYAGTMLFIAFVILVGSLLPAIYLLPSYLNEKWQAEDATEDRASTETTTIMKEEISYGQFFKSYRSLSNLVLSVLITTPLIYKFGLLSTRLIAMGLT